MTLTPPWRRRFAAALLLCPLFISPAAFGAPPETLKVGGTGAALGTLRLLGAEFSRQHPAIRIEVLPYIGSTGAIKGVAAGTLDLGLSARPAKPEEQKLDLRLSRYALTPLVIATHSANPLRSISRQQLAAIYAGQLARWEGGGLIRIILRPAYETDNEVLRQVSPAVSSALDSALSRPGMRLAATDQDAADALEQTPGAIGTTTLALLRSENRKLGALAIDGVAPELEAVKNGRYPFSKPLYLVTSGTPSPAVQALVAFIRSPRGQQILLANGQLPTQP